MVTISRDEYEALLKMKEEYEELIKIKEENEVLKGLVTALTARVTELEAQLNKNSKNSNKPPSSDGLKKGAPKNSREPSGRRSGGQPGHKGATKEFNPTPDTIIKLEPKTKCECGAEKYIKPVSLREPTAHFITAVTSLSL